MTPINVAEVMGASNETIEKNTYSVVRSGDDFRNPSTFFKKQRADLHNAEVRLSKMLGYLEEICTMVNKLDHSNVDESWFDAYKDLCFVMNNCINEEKEIIARA